MNFKLQQYVSEARQLGMSDEQIREELVKSGWNISSIENALKIIPRSTRVLSSPKGKQSLLVWISLSLVGTIALGLLVTAAIKNPGDFFFEIMRNPLFWFVISATVVGVWIKKKGTTVGKLTRVIIILIPFLIFFVLFVINNAFLKIEVVAVCPTCNDDITYLDDCYLYLETIKDDEQFTKWMSEFDIKEVPSEGVIKEISLPDDTVRCTYYKN